MDGVGAVLRAAAGIFVFMFGLTTAVLGVAGQGFPSEGASRNADCTAALEKGKQLLAQHGSSEAQQLLAEAVGSCPDVPELWNRLGLAYDGDGHHNEAQAAFGRAIRLDPHDTRFRNNLAASYIRSGKQTIGIAEFEKVLELDPGNPTACLNLGSFYLRKKQYQRAVFYFDAGAFQRSQDPLELFELTEAYYGAGKANQAKQTAIQLASLPGVDSKTHFSLGLLLAEHGEYHLAAGQFEAIPPVERDGAANINLGMAYSKLGRSDQAHAAYSAAIRDDPANPEPYFRIGLAESAIGRHQAAADWMNEAKGKAPGRTDISYALAEELMHDGNFERANSVLTLALSVHPSDPALREATGDLLASQNRLQDAVKAYKECLRFDPRRLSARLSLARAYGDMAQTENARAALAEVLRLDPKNAEAEAQLGRYALEAGNPQDASALIRSALAHDPRNISANEYYARLQIRDGKLNGARETLEKLVQLDPQNYRFHFLLGGLLARLNQAAEAEKEFELFRRLQPKHGSSEE
ncbi:MAG: hypothetical protein DMG42_36660 [Acidobacteria bacterium]|nr:MAG: hypothetical protein DMG42_36660 [Acidobacteriota bacterium]